MSLSTPPLDRSCRFQIQESDLGHTAYRFHANHDLLWCSGPYPTEREARRELVLEQTRAMIAEEEDGFGPEETSEGPVESTEVAAEELDLENLVVRMVGGEELPIVWSVGPDRQPSVDPGVVLLLAGPDRLGKWVVLTPQWEEMSHGPH